MEISLWTLFSYPFAPKDAFEAVIEQAGSSGMEGIIMYGVLMIILLFFSKDEGENQLKRNVLKSIEFIGSIALIFLLGLFATKTAAYFGGTGTFMENMAVLNFVALTILILMMSFWLIGMFLVGIFFSMYDLRKDFSLSTIGWSFIAGGTLMIDMWKYLFIIAQVWSIILAVVGVQIANGILLWQSIVIVGISTLVVAILEMVFIKTRKKQTG